MALYFPKQRVALDFVDVPGYDPEPRDDRQGWSKLPVSSEELTGWHSYQQLMHHLARMLKDPAAEGPERDEAMTSAQEELLAQSA